MEMALFLGLVLLGEKIFRQEQEQRAWAQIGTQRTLRHRPRRLFLQMQGGKNKRLKTRFGGEQRCDPAWVYSEPSGTRGKNEPHRRLRRQNHLLFDELDESWPGPECSQDDLDWLFGENEQFEGDVSQISCYSADLDGTTRIEYIDGAVETILPESSIESSIRKPQRRRVSQVSAYIAEKTQPQMLSRPVPPESDEHDQDYINRMMSAAGPVLVPDLYRLRPAR
jgi:hypothetical protein